MGVPGCDRWRGPLARLFWVVALLQHPVGASVGDGLRYLSLQDDGQETATSFAMWGCPPPSSSFADNVSLNRSCSRRSLLVRGNPRNFTACYFLRMTGIKHHNFAFTFMSSSLRFKNTQGSGTTVNGAEDFVHISFPTNFLHWTSYCVVMLEGKAVSVYEDGSLLDTLELEQATTATSEDCIILGQSQSHMSQLSLAGHLADFQMWTKALTAEEVKMVAACENLSAAPQVFLNSDQWLLNGTAVWVIHEAVTSVCQLKPFSGQNWIILKEDFRDKGLELCRTLGGRFPTPSDKISSTLLEEFVLSHHPYTDGIHLGIKKSKTGWTDAYDGQPVTFWANRSLIQSEQADVCLNPILGTWVERENPVCLVVCETPVRKVFLKGLCAASVFTKELWVHQSVSGRLVLREAGTFILQPNEPRGEWSLTSSTHTRTWAKVKPKTSQFPFGEEVWRVWDEECGYGGETITLMLTACPRNMFTCGDLSCIPNNKMCDMRDDCSDHSDEHCSNKVQIPQNYIRLPPKPDPSSPLTVRCHIAIINYRSFSIKEMEWVIDFSIMLEWRDVRLKYFYLNNIQEPAYIKEHKESIWLPKFSITSGLGLAVETEELHRKLTAISDGGPAEPDDLSTFHGGVIPGRFVTLQLAVKLSVTASCDPSLYKFPFDTQTCLLFLDVASGPASRLEAGELTKHSAFRERLLEHYIQNITLVVTQSEEKHKGFRAVLVTVFGHLYGYYVISIFMPTLLLVIVSYSSFYFEPDDFTDRIMVALTSLLVLATFISTASSNMARVSYFTLLDIWLSFCIVLVFCICLCHTLLLALGRSRGGVEERMEQQWAKVTPGNITVRIKEDPDNSVSDSRRRHIVDVAIKICVPVVIIVFITTFFYIGLQDEI